MATEYKNTKVSVNINLQVINVFTKKSTVDPKADIVELFKYGLSTLTSRH